ncbi:hypothetical protein DPM19_03505 [Actinomadura craniellae]|uniref:Uncharacterized protein n=1 Tax=Actinomadura craniellae TaxID=2231787 RepID=A0A365HDM0_9ACTN|nr:hypothetical protein DPM19_03505 [Actinomadura craniellae]
MAGLFVVLGAVAGLAFTYGLGHPQSIRSCTAHITGAVGVLGVASAAGHPPEPGSLNPCVYLAVLLVLVALGLAGRSRRVRTAPRRTSRSPNPPVSRPAPAPSLASLQVLRL